MTAGTVQAKVRYLNPEWKGRNERPRIGSRESRHAHTTPYEVCIADARPTQERGDLALDRNGFVLVGHRSAVRDFRDDAEVRRTYYEEMRAVLLGLTGADQVVTLQHLRRTEDSRDFNSAYARYVHCDFSEEVGASTARRLLVSGGYSRDEAERCSFAMYNVWQPIEREVQQNPLTMIDSRTLKVEDLVEYTYTATAADGVAVMPIHDPGHRFHYFPRMRPDEAIVFKQLDSRSDRARFCPHTSFHDPGAPANALGRRSIELRLVCGFRDGRPA